MSRGIKNILNKLAASLFPDNYNCIICKTEILPSRYGICEHCSFTLNDKKVCKKCGTPLNVESNYCLDCPISEYNYRAARSALIYDDNLHRLIHNIKFGSAKWIIKYLPAYMCDLYFKLNWDIDIIIPVPLYPKKQKKRGFNQSAELASHISEAFSIPLELNALYKIRNTKDQARLSKDEREKNLEGAFIGNKELSLKDKNILLIDDLMTTGTTFNTCAEALLPLKPKNIYALALATPQKRLTEKESDFK